jgi:hypothetical protein
MRKTLIIGLGGTGLRIIKDVRERLIWQYGSLNCVPFIQFLGIDSSTDESLSDVNDFLHVTVDESTFEKMRAMPEEFSSIDLATWRDAAIFSGKDAITDGCHGVRMFGRLAFLFKGNFREIENSLRNKINKLIEVSSADITQTFSGPHQPVNLANFDPTVNIYVVANTVAGTGSGMAIDVGYFLQTLLPQFAGTAFRTIAILTLASPSEVDEIKLANTYATALEINHFSMDQTVYRARYDGYSRPIELETRPFDFLYLISNQRSFHSLQQKVADQFQVMDPMRLEEIAGQYIYTDAFVEETDDRDGRRDDTKDFFTLPDKLMFPQRYFTFGLSSIEFPVKQCALGCSSLLSKDTIQDWAAAKEPLITDFQALLNSIKLSAARPGEAGTLGQELISTAGDPRNERLNIVTKIRETIEHEGIRSFAANSGSLARADMNLANGFAEGMQGTQGSIPWGRFLEVIEGNRRRLRAELRRNLLDQVSKWVFDLDRGPGYCHAQLAKAGEAVQERINKLSKGDYDKVIEQKRREKDKAEDTVQLTLRDLLLQIPLPFPRWWALKVYLRQYQRKAEEYFKQKLNQICAESERKLLGEDILPLIGQLDSRLNHFEVYLINVKSHFEAVYRKCLEPVNINGLSLFDDPAGTMQYYYDKLVPIERNQRHAIMAKIVSNLDELRKQLFPDDSSGNESSRFDNGNPVKLRYDEKNEDQDFRRYADCNFTEIANTDVLERLAALDNAPAEVARVSTLSSWFLGLDLGDENFIDHTRKVKRYFFFHGAKADNPPEHVARFKELLQASVRNLEPEELYELPDPHQVIFLQERGAFPMRIIHSLGSKTLSRVSELLLTRRARADIAPIPLDISNREQLRKAEELLLVAIGLQILERVTVKGEIKFLLKGDEDRGLRSSGEREYDSNFAKAALSLHLDISAWRVLENRVRAFRREPKYGDHAMIERLAGFPKQINYYGLEGITPEQARVILDRYVKRDKDLLKIHDALFPLGAQEVPWIQLDPGMQSKNDEKRVPFLGYYCRDYMIFFGSSKEDIPRDCSECRLCRPDA